MSKEEVIEIISLIVLKTNQKLITSQKTPIIMQNIVNYLKKKKKNVVKKKNHVKINIK